MRHKHLCASLASLLLLLTILLTACGGSAPSMSRDAANSNSQPSQSQPSSSDNGSSSTTSKSQGETAPTTDPNNVKKSGPQYLVKTLNVTLQVKDTRKVANELQKWILTNDTQATSAGTSYSQSYANSYNVSLTFSVQASLYPKIYEYIRDYKTQPDERLLKLDESVVDVTNNYINTQSRIKTLQTEQTRLRELISKANTLDDILRVEQKLTEVETQLETAESQFKNITSQINYYTVTINLIPSSTYVKPTPTEGGWSVANVFQDAIAASIILGQNLLTFIIWLLAFSIYIVPALLLIWFTRRWYIRHSLRLSTITPPSTPTQQPKDE